jgi:predicted RNA-binding Zn ribbon-like protein
MANPGLPVDILFAGGRLCLDFVNSLCNRLGARLDLLESPDELKTWLRMAESVYEQPLCPEEQVWTDNYGNRMLARAIRLRAALNELMTSVRESRSASAEAVAVVNEELRANPQSLRLSADANGFGQSTTNTNDQERWITRIAEDAVDFLTNMDRSLLKQCEHVSCIRVFYDTSKNHTRRWCVERCGNRTRAAAQYRRKKAASRA